MFNKIPVNWECKTIDDIALKVGSGVTPRGGASTYLASGIKFIRSQNVHFDGLKLDDVVYISREVHDSMSSTKLFEGDVLLNITGASIGRCTYVPTGFNEGNVNQHVCIIRTDSDVNPKYVAQWISSDFGQQSIFKYQAGGNREGLNFQQIRSIPINVPPLPEQQKIASVLAAVDEVIESTQAQINKLKDLKTGMMQELLTKGIGHTEFKDSPVGRIPKDWKITNLGQVTIAKGMQTGPFGSQLHSHEYVDVGVPVVMPKDMKDQNIVASTIAKITQEKADELSRHKLLAGDILFSRRGDIGRCVIVKTENQGWICGTGCLKARLNDALLPEYFIFYLTLSSVIEWLNNNAVGQTMLNLNTSILADLPVILPPLNEQHAIAASMQALISTLNTKELKLHQLKNTKKALMQDLLTGKVRVKVNPQ